MISLTVVVRENYRRFFEAAGLLEKDRKIEVPFRQRWGRQNTVVGF